MGVALSLALTACGGPVLSGVAMGKAGSRVSAYSATTPQGAEVCAMQDALGAAGSDKAASDVCAKALKADHVWRQSMVVLGAYGSALEVMASGQGGDRAGHVEAALARGADGVEPDGAAEKAAREASTQLVGQLGNARGDLAQTVKDAAPHVKAICDGLTSYLDAQARGFADAQKEAEKKHASRTDRRCGSLDGRSVCVSESVIDRLLYAKVFGHAASLESAHVSAHNAVSAFCAAHKKAEEAANDGRLGKDKTQAEIIDAMKAAPRAMSSLEGKSGGGKPATPPKK